MDRGGSARPHGRDASGAALRQHYQDVGVAEYWIVDIDGGVVERWRPTDERPEINAGTLAWQPDPRVPALVIDLEKLWDEAAAVSDEADEAD